MKKYILILIALVCFAPGLLAQINCCPEFSLKFDKDATQCCNPKCMENGKSCMCKYNTNPFLVVPNFPGEYTYTWVVSGGTPTSCTGNPVNITWGGGETGTIIVTIFNQDSTCFKIIKENFCLRDAPNPHFTFTPNNACKGTTVHFTNTSTGGASVSWNFGDGQFAGNVDSPTHVYQTAGTYPVSITVCNDVTCIPTPDRPCCGCCTTYTDSVTVSSGIPLTIVPNDCNLCLCPGDVAEYCASDSCSIYNWTLTGGEIISGLGTKCVKVRWTGPYPTSLSLSTPGCGNTCGDSTSLNVPVLVSNIPIMPHTIVCANSIQTYYLPVMPGVSYNWQVTGGAIVGPSINTSSIVVSWYNGHSGTVKCVYINSLNTTCQGSSLLDVTIKPVLSIQGQSGTCEGCPADFSALVGINTTPTVWSSSDPSAVFNPTNGPGNSIHATFAQAGIYTITATNPNFCNSPVSATIIVAPKPILSITPTTAVACPGDIVKFVATSNVKNTPILWPDISGATMVANTGEQLDTAYIQFNLIPPANTITITATQKCVIDTSCSPGTASSTITKPPSPVLNAPITNPCIDQTVLYSISDTIPGIEYTWSVTNGLGTIIPGLDSRHISVLWHGNANPYGILSVSNCGGTFTVPITVTVPQFPVIVKTGTCLSSGIVLHSSLAGIWHGPGISGQTPSPSITITQPGTYTVTVNSGVPDSCPVSGRTFIASSFYWLRIVPPCYVSTCISTSMNVPLTVLTSLPSLTNCQWFLQLPGGTTFTQVSTTNGIYTATSLGTYYLTATDPNGCTITSNQIRIPDGINMCCYKPACNALDSTKFNFSHSGCQPKNFIGAPDTLPVGWTKGTIHPIICYGDGLLDDFESLNTNHHYPSAGSYTACVYQKVVNIASNDTCCISKCKEVIIPVDANFVASYNCTTGILNLNANSSSFYPSSSGAVYTWTYPGTYSGSLTNSPIQNITPTSSGNYTITLSIQLDTCTSNYSLQIPIALQHLNFTISNNPTCDGSAVTFSTPAQLASYHWKFGDGNFSYLPNPTHVYPGPGTYTVDLVGVTNEGCHIISNGTVTVQPKPIVTVPATSFICPGGSVNLNAGIQANGNSMCQTYHYQWYRDGVLLGIQPDTPTFNATTFGNYHVVLTGTDSNCNCVITSNKALVKMYPKPIAKIKGKSVMCIGEQQTLQNSINSTGYSYVWSILPTVFPNNIASSININIANPGNYMVHLQVTDANGCTAKDSLCIFVYPCDTVAIAASPTSPLCEGVSHNFTVTTSDTTSTYLWSNGAVGDTTTTSVAGNYYVTAVNMVSGCSAQSNHITVLKHPNVSLFPACCDTICNTLCSTTNLDPLLPNITPPAGYNSTYNIVWHDVYNNDTTNYTGPSFPLDSIATQIGHHYIHIDVHFAYNNCIIQSGIYDLYIKDCNNCNCTESQFTNLNWNLINDTLNNTTFRCGDRLGSFNCNNPISIQAGFACGSQNCTSLVLYSLLDSAGNTRSGSMPFDTSGLPTGSYTLLMIGQCNSINCDTCRVTFQIKCDPPSGCCPQLGQITIRNSNETLVQQSPQGHDYSLYTTQVSIAGGTVPYTEVRASVVDFKLSSNYNSCIDCKNYPFTWASLAATSLAGIQPTTTGVTPSMGYNITSNIYGNPREVVWNNNSNINLNTQPTQSTKLSFYLPPKSLIPCCGLKATICVKFSLKDINCNLCEIVKCYEVVIGDTIVHESCCCENWNGKPVTIRKATIPVARENHDPTDISIKPYIVNCGDSISLTSGYYNITAPVFTCNPTTCNVSYTWTVTTKSLESEIADIRTNQGGPGNSFGFNFNIPGSYLVTFTPKCGSCKCEPCRFTVIIKK